MKSPVTVDLSSALRLQGLVNRLRDLGFVAAGFLIFLSIGDRRLLIAAGVCMIASIYLARGSRVAAIALVVTALAVAALFEHSYRAALEQHQLRVSKEMREDPRELSEFAIQQELIELNRKLAWLSAGLGLLYLGALIMVLRLRHRMPRPKANLNRRQRLALWLASLRARMVPKAVIYFALALVCMVVVAGPAIGLLAGLLLRVSPSGPFAALLDWQYDDWWQTALTFVCGIGGLILFVRAKRHAALSVSQVRALDPRDPIILLRSFQDDITPLQRSNDPRAWMRSLIVPKVWTLEETIEQLLVAEGPVIAIGRPGESLPPAGVAREYVSDDRWRDRVQMFIEQAALVVVILGETEGLKFEYRAIVRLGALGKLIAIFPARKTETLNAIWRQFAETVAADPLASELDVSRALAVCFQDGVQPVLVNCHWRDDEDCYRLVLQYCLGLLRCGGEPLQLRKCGRTQKDM